jgi:translation initiation factor IF-3
LNKRTIANNRIRSRKVRVVDENGKQAGILELQDALRLSLERGLDLVQVTEKVDPPVCKIMDLGKYLYQKEKKEKGVKKKGGGGEMKGIRLSFRISEHDMETKAKNAVKFLEKGNRVRVELRLKGREKALGDFAREKIVKFLEIIKEKVEYKTEREIKRQPRGITTIISKKISSVKNI